jgi:hypothetical protein
MSNIIQTRLHNRLRLSNTARFPVTTPRLKSARGRRSPMLSVRVCLVCVMSQGVQSPALRGSSLGPTSVGGLVIGFCRAEPMLREFPGASRGQQEIERRCEIVRQFFNDFWRSADDKPSTFAERLNRAEDHINERLAVRGETWQLDAATRKQLGLPPPKNRVD